MLTECVAQLYMQMTGNNLSLETFTWNSIIFFNFFFLKEMPRALSSHWCHTYKYVIPKALSNMEGHRNLVFIVLSSKEPYNISS